MTIWTEKLRNGDITINEVKPDATIACVVFNKDIGECSLLSNFSAKKNPSVDDIKFFFENSETVLKMLSDAGIILEKPCSILLPA